MQLYRRWTLSQKQTTQTLISHITYKNDALCMVKCLMVNSNQPAAWKSPKSSSGASSAPISLASWSSFFSTSSRFVSRSCCSDDLWRLRLDGDFGVVAAGESGPGGGGGGMIGGMVSIDLPLSSNERLLRLFSTS